jgi:hypothetical protein
MGGWEQIDQFACSPTLRQTQTSRLFWAFVDGIPTLNILILSLYYLLSLSNNVGGYIHANRYSNIIICDSIGSDACRMGWLSDSKRAVRGIFTTVRFLRHSYYWYDAHSHQLREFVSREV